MNALGTLDKILCFLGRSAIISVVCIVVIYICFAAFVYAATWLWPDFYGSYCLGNNIYMLEGDKTTKTIVYGTSIKGKTCYSGEPLIPTYDNQYDSIGNFAEYVVDAKADDNWIIAKTDNKSNHQKKYYIINKSNGIERLDAQKILKNNITSYTDSVDFSNACQQYGIRMNW